MYPTVIDDVQCDELAFIYPKVLLSRIRILEMTENVDTGKLYGVFLSLEKLVVRTSIQACLNV